MFWNVNGLRARWTAKELGFKEGVESKNPDVCAVLEVRSDWRNLAKMDGFESWLRDKEYHFCCGQQRIRQELERQGWPYSARKNPRGCGSE
jgi:exonuclease III